ncbi:MAG: mandelate racemase/muconate lactonizing enzyme family protein [Bacteroidetes bacterium]|jgi:L-alanine-DL-glutamate epimerase-like enolase superfamily enzyme|nr:mandelate racemase/muconate lactonizing enzyme family protein [Bacteroidota bacterium]
MKNESNYGENKTPLEGSSTADIGASDVRSNKVDRRNFIKKAGAGGLGLFGMFALPFEDQIGHLAQNVNRYSSPSELEITDLRIAEIDGIPFRVPLIRIDTNQGISGYGEVRDGGAKEYALFLKSRLLGENPCNVEKVFKIIKQFGGHGRLGGGVSGVETALWDLTGKAYDVPVYQLLGGKYRDKVRLYCDTTTSDDPHEYARRMQERIEMGYTFLKMDMGIQLVDDEEGSLTNTREYGPKGQRELRSQYSGEQGDYGQIDHPFTRIQVTQQGLERMMEYLRVMRDTIGYEIPMGTDHWGHFDKNEAIKIARAAEPYTLAYVEDLIAWQYADEWKEISEATTTPTMTGEDIYLLDGFKELIDKQAVDMVHPDLGSAGGILETKRIGDYAMQNGIAMMLHYAGAPFGFMASVHAAAATENFVALEHHSVDTPNWYDLVQEDKSAIFQDGYTPVPEKPGLGVEINEDAVREHLIEDAGYFEPTPEWDEIRTWDRTWS